MSRSQKCKHVRIVAVITRDPNPHLATQSYPSEKYLDLVYSFHNAWLL